MPTSPTTTCHVYAVVSPDGLLRGEAAHALEKRINDETGAMDPMRYEGAKAVVAEVLDDVRTPSLLGEHRVVLVDDADTFITAHRAALERYCASPATSGTLILLCSSLPRNTRLAKIIDQQGGVIRCELPKPRAVASWIVERAKGVYGKRMSTQAARSLREHLGDAPGILDAELSKLATFVGERADIQPADIDALTGNRREEKVFAVTDALAAGDAASAMHHWEQVLATDRAAPGRAIAGLAWGVRRLLQARRDWEGGTNVHVLARRLFTEPDVLERRLRLLTVDRLEAQQRDLLSADLDVKTGRAKLDTAIERFIIKHSAAQQRT